MAYRRLRISTKSTVGATFNDFILHKMANDRREILQIFADKWKVREYVKERIGDEYLPNVYFHSGLYLTVRPVDLPEEFALKATHCSGGSILVWKGAAKDSTLPVPMKLTADLNRYRLHPDGLNWERILAHANLWLDIDYSWRPEMIFPEWAYDGIPRGIVFEELLLDDGQIPQDFKFFVFNGQVKLIRVDSPDQVGKKTMSHFNPSWELLNLEFRVGKSERYGNSQITINSPGNLDEMIDIAERLSSGIDFLRVDLYSIKGKIYFGELTSYPSAGKGIFQPDSFNFKMGEFFKGIQ